MKTNDNIFGSTYGLWRRLQDGQEKIIRFGSYHKRFKNQIRKQNGHEHQCSVMFLFYYFLIQIRPYVKLDELLLTRCANIHDVPEGISGIDTPAPTKKDEDDLGEYIIFRRLYKPLGRKVWIEMQRAFLLQFALKNPSCFPAEARRVMKESQEKNYYEALFFDGVQRMDYLYYAYECYQECGISILMREVTQNQFHILEDIAYKLPGFSQIVWTPKVRRYFKTFISGGKNNHWQNWKENVAKLNITAQKTSNRPREQRELLPVLEHLHD